MLSKSYRGLVAVARISGAPAPSPMASVDASLTAAAAAAASSTTNSARRNHSVLAGSRRGPNPASTKLLLFHDGSSSCGLTAPVDVERLSCRTITSFLSPSTSASSLITNYSCLLGYVVFHHGFTACQLFLSYDGFIQSDNCEMIFNMV